MSISIIDADMNIYLHTVFNLEAMKISSYYKKRREIVLLSSEIYPERHEKLFYRKDYNDGMFPSKILEYKNIESGGYAFTGNTYQPLDLNIEKCSPDTSLYEKFRKPFCAQKGKDKIFNAMIAAEHCRMSLDGKTIWKDYGSQFRNLKGARTIIFHDYDLNKIEGIIPEIKKILARARTDGWATTIGSKFPIVVNNGQDLIEWCSFKTSSYFFQIEYLGILDMDHFTQWINLCNGKTIYTYFGYNVTQKVTEQFLIKYGLEMILNQIVMARSRRIFFTLKYDKGFFSDKRWELVLKLFNFYLNSMKNTGCDNYLYKIEYDTLYDFAKNTRDDKNLEKYYNDYLTKTQIRQIFKFVREKNYTLFTKFYETSIHKLEENNGIK